MEANVFKGISEKDAVPIIGRICQEDMKKSDILASVSAAQFILESGYGTTELAQNANNCFGMKKNLSNNTWSGTTWDGVSIYTKKTTEEYREGEITVITADFRKYPCIEDCVADHSAYLLGAKNGRKLRYAGLKGEKDYRKAIQIIKDGGYATDSKYVDKLCNIIEMWNLTQYDVDMPQPQPQPQPQSIKYYVQAGAFTIKENAEAQLERVRSAGFDAFIKYENGYYKIQAGAYSVRENAEARLQRLQEAGFGAFIKTV